MRNIDLRFIYVIVVIINTVENRKYDIEQQCMTEYGLSLEGVLRQFRRSDDYVKILKMKVQEFSIYFMDVIYQSYDWNVKKMREQIEADFGLNSSVPESVATTKGTAVKLSDCNATEKMQKLKSRLGINRRRGADESHARGIERSLKNIRRIDEHPKLNLYLSVDERNHYRNIGFQYAGDVIHAVIHAFGGSLTDSVTASYGSTRLTLPGETDEPTTTTKHVLRHTVEKSGESEGMSTMGHQHTPPKKYLLMSKYQPRHRRKY